MKTAVVILNWNTRSYLQRFLPSLISGTKGLDAEIIVADNASSDASLELMRGEFPQIRTIALDSNYGFAEGYNRALDILFKDSDPEYVVLLNSDLEAGEGWLGAMVEYMDSHPDIAVCGPKLHALLPCGEGWVRSTEFEYAGAAGGYLDRYCFPFCRGRVLSRTETDRGQYDSVKRVFWVSGACLMTRSSVWRELGGLDGSFFAHQEEIDYCWRAALKGWKTCVLPQSCVYHIGGGSLPSSSPFKLKLNYRNSLLMMEKNLAASLGEKEAARRLRTRLNIDRLARMAYLLTGRKAEAQAVKEAHEEYFKMRKSLKINSCAHPEKPYGLMDINIILQAILRGKRIFKRINTYENSH